MRTFIHATAVAAGVALLGAGALGTSALKAGQAPVALYTAVYEAEYKGRKLGTAVLSVTSEDGGYVFESRTEARGLLKLMRPNPLLEQSRFSVVDGAVRPSSFVYEDGSRRGEDNFRAEFDWDAGVVTVEGESGRAEHALDGAPALDRGSMQVALMRDLARGARVGPYVLVDDDGLETYHYEREADERIETPAGELDARVYAQTREGSSRVTRLWVVPSLQFLPARIAQFRDGELYTDFTLESVEGL